MNYQVVKLRFKAKDYKDVFIIIFIIMKRVTLRTKDFLRQLGDYSINISKKSVVELVDKQIVFIDKNPSFFYYENKLIPNLHFLQRENV